MDEEKQICGNCRFAENLPFADETVCANPDSEYADCPCNTNDTCSEYTAKE